MLEDQKNDQSSYQQFVLQSESNLNHIYEYLRNFSFDKGIVEGGSNSTPFPFFFQYHGICENLLIEVFSK